MKRLFVFSLLMFVSACASTSITPPLITPEIVGPVVDGRLAGSPTPTHIPFSNTAGSPTIATEAFALPRAGGTATGTVNVITTSANKAWLAKYASGSGHTDAPSVLGATSQYLVIGGREYGNNTYRTIGLGYVGSPADHAPGAIGYQERNTASFTLGDLIFATRNVTSNTAPSVRMRIGSDGQILGEGTYAPTTDQSLTTKKYVDAQSLTPAAKTAVKALTPASTLVDVINALQK